MTLYNLYARYDSLYLKNIERPIKYIKDDKCQRKYDPRVPVDCINVTNLWNYFHLFDGLFDWIHYFRLSFPSFASSLVVSNTVSSVVSIRSRALLLVTASSMSMAECGCVWIVVLLIRHPFTRIFTTVICVGRQRKTWSCEWMSLPQLVTIWFFLWTNVVIDANSHPVLFVFKLFNHCIRFISSSFDLLSDAWKKIKRRMRETSS